MQHVEGCSGVCWTRAEVWGAGEDTSKGGASLPGEMRMCQAPRGERVVGVPTMGGPCTWELRGSVASTLLVTDDTNTICTCLTEKEFLHYFGSSGSGWLQA